MFLCSVGMVLANGCIHLCVSPGKELRLPVNCTFRVVRGIATKMVYPASTARAYRSALTQFTFVFLQLVFIAKFTKDRPVLINSNDALKWAYWCSMKSLRPATLLRAACNEPWSSVPP
jgi:hypothetical protein